MKFNFNSLNNGGLSLEIKKTNFDNNWSSLMKSTDRKFIYNLKSGDNVFTGTGIRGDDALWIPYSENVGIKIIASNDRYQSLEDSLKTVNLIKDKLNYIFPEIYDCKVALDSITDEKYLIIVMENMGSEKQPAKDAPNFIPEQHKSQIANMLQMHAGSSLHMAVSLKNMNLCPEDEWYKSINLINGRIVDFHRFRFMPERYIMPSNGVSVNDMSQIYQKMVDRYKEVLDNHGQPKWKGKIYQGFHFDNGYSMKGYTSHNGIYDSFIKLPYVPLNKSEGKKVLDIGSNQGFFSFQAALHGAKEVVGVELTKQYVLAANDIKEILQLNNVKFINGDAVKYVMDTKDRFGLVILNSVLHQIYPNFENSDSFLEKLAKSCDYMAFETPLNHPLMNISPQSVEQNLKRHFRIVRLLSVYDAYSSGYRANFVCYS